jgi:hypothetical protein
MHYAMAGLLAVAVLARPVRAQGTADLLTDGTAIGATAGTFRVDGEALWIGSFHAYGLRAHRASAAFALATPPQAWGDGALLLMPDLGVAYNVSLPGATLLLKGGGSAILGASGESAGAFLGVHLGATFLIQTGARVGLLIDATEHWYWADGDGARVLSLGIGVTALPRRVR